MRPYNHKGVQSVRHIQATHFDYKYIQNKYPNMFRWNMIISFPFMANTKIEQSISLLASSN